MWYGIIVHSTIYNFFIHIYYVTMSFYMHETKQGYDLCCWLEALLYLYFRGSIPYAFSLSSLKAEASFPFFFLCLKLGSLVLIRWIFILFSLLSCFLKTFVDLLPPIVRAANTSQFDSVSLGASILVIWVVEVVSLFLFFFFFFFFIWTGWRELDWMDSVGLDNLSTKC